MRYLIYALADLAFIAAFVFVLMPHKVQEIGFRLLGSRVWRI